MAVSQRLKELLAGEDGVLGGASGQTAHIHLADLGLSLSGETINKMKDHGVYGREASLRTLAMGYASEFWRRHGEEIAAFARVAGPAGLSTDEVRKMAADWFVYEVVTSRPDIPRPSQNVVADSSATQTAPTTPAADSPTPDAGLLEQAAAAGARKALEEAVARGWLVIVPGGTEPANMLRDHHVGYDHKPDQRQRFPRPRDYFWARFGELVDLCARLGLPEPAIPSFRGGSDSLTHEEADAKLAEILEELRAEHPDRARALVLE